MQRILVAGAAGFIGSQLVVRLQKELTDVTIVGLDSVNDYYDVRIKEYRLKQLEDVAAQHNDNKWVFVKGNIADKALVDALFAEYNFEAHKELVAMQPGDVPITFADATALERDFGFKPHTSLRDGLRRFAEWYKEFYG